MYCSNCNNDVPDSSIMCPICGEPVAKKIPTPGSGINMFPAGGSSYYNDSPASPSYMDLSPAKKKSGANPLVFVIIILALAAFCVFAYFKIFNKKTDHNGTYHFKSITTEGVTMTNEVFMTYGYDLSGLTIIISENTATLSGWGMFGYANDISTPININGDKVEFPLENGLTGEFDGNEITVYMDTSSTSGSITFAK